jgi:DNA-binding NtrC family response regulator
LEKQIHILTVDDDDSFRIIIEEILAKQGFKVSAASDGNEAITLIQHHEYDLILLDIKMPTVDGFEVLKFVKKRNPATKVIMLTGYADLKLAVDAKNLGADDFVAKPIMRDDLMNSIEKALKK